MRRTTLLLAATVLAAAPALAPLPLVAPAAQARGIYTSYADLAEKLLPSVVNIASSTSVQARTENPGPEMPQFPPGSPFEQMFKDFMQRRGMNPHGQEAEPGAPRKMQSAGSGFIIDPTGFIVTNNHVIDGADDITVTFQDGTSLKAKLIGRDERADLALLKVESPKPLPAVAWGDSDKSRVGDAVLAIGNPFALGGSVTAGIVSARNRNINQGPYDDFIQTDAAINKGNSGGPLFNIDGDVIGINTAIYSPSGGSIGIGFSIPSNEAKPIIAQLKDFGKARRGWLGVRIQQVTPEIAESVGLSAAKGAMIAGVNDGGPADKGHLKNGDIVLKFNNEDVREMRNLPRIVAETRIGDTVPVVIWRDGKTTDANVTVGELPDEAKLAKADPAQAAEPDRASEMAGLGLSLAPLTADQRQKYQIGPDQKGVVVTNVVQGGTGADRGLKAGDVIVEVQQKPVTTPDDVKTRVDEARKQSRKSVLMLVQNSDGLRWVPLSLTDEKKPG